MTTTQGAGCPEISPAQAAQDDFRGSRPSPTGDGRGDALSGAEIAPAKGRSAFDVGLDAGEVAAKSGNPNRGEGCPYKSVKHSRLWHAGFCHGWNAWHANRRKHRSPAHLRAIRAYLGLREARRECGFQRGRADTLAAELALAGETIAALRQPLPRLRVA